MSGTKALWMPLHIADYLADTSRLTTEGHGAYLLLLMDYWRNGPPPDDDEVLGAITKLAPARWAKLRPTLAEFFTVQEGRWHQKRADAEIAKAGKVIGERSAAGKAGATKRWGVNDGKPDGGGSGKQHGKSYAPANGKDDGKAIAKPKQDAWQNDAQSQSQSDPSSEAAASSPPRASPVEPPAAAAEADRRCEIGKRVLAAARIDDARWTGNFAIISAWLSAGYDPDMDILPAVNAVAARPGYKPPNGLNYFTKPIGQHWESRQLAVPDFLRREPESPAERAHTRALELWAANGCQGPKPERSEAEAA